MFIADLHVHSNHSNDGVDCVKALIATAVEKGLNCISITDHNTVNGSLEAIEYVEEEHVPIAVIPGIEVSTSNGHMLAYGIKQDVDKEMSMRETAMAVKKLGGIAVMAHPFQLHRHGVVAFWRVIDVIDAIEVFNAKFCIGLCNRLSEVLAKKYGKPGLAGSDAHCRQAVGYGVTIIEGANPLEAIISGRVRIKGKRIPLNIQLKNLLKTP